MQRKLHGTSVRRRGQRRKSRLGNATVDRNEVIIEAFLASEDMDCIARYLSRGRRLQSLGDSTLKQRWIVALRRSLHHCVENSAAREDISAELSLRGIRHVELPLDLKAAILAKAVTTKHAMELDPEFLKDLLDEIAQFGGTLAKSKKN
jgi:hypothetical protein